MAEITAASVKELRERTGAGMMDCKKALGETNGDMEAAIDWLRTKGLAAAAKKAGRTAAEGLVGVAVEGTKGAVVEVNSETDFVAKNEQFQEFVREVSKLALGVNGDIEALKAVSYPGGGTVEEKLTDNIATIGENQSLRRAALLDVSEGAVVSYVHNAAAPNMGKIGMLVALEGSAPADTGQLASIQSRPLPDVIAEMLTNSDNNTAELVLKEIGLASSGAGTRQAGADAVTATLNGWGVDTTGLVVADGSGLSADNRISCATMLAVLQHAGYDSPVGQGLAIGGETGTLVDAFGDTAVAGRIRGKTGTLNNAPYDQDPPAVKALSGYMPIEGGGAIEYTLLLNGGIITDQSEYRPLWNELAVAVDSFPAVASPAVLGPQ